MVYRMELIYDEIVDNLDVKCVAGSTVGYTLIPGIYKWADINLMLKSLLLKKVKVNNKNDDIRLRSILSANKTMRFTEK